MTLPAPRSLADIRAEVFVRCTINTGGDRGARAAVVVNSCIRQACRTLELSSPWLKLAATRTIALVTGQTDYNFPDDMDAGRIQGLFAHQVSTGKHWPVIPSPTQFQRNSLLTSTIGRPVYYWFEDEVLRVAPSVDQTLWDSLRVDGFLRSVEPVSDGDLIPLDGEAVIQRSELLARPRLGQLADPVLEKAHLAYLRDLKATQTEGGGFVLGGDSSVLIVPEEAGVLRSPYLQYDANWQPNGNWGPV